MRFPRRCKWNSTVYMVLLSVIVLVSYIYRQSNSAGDDTNISGTVSEQSSYFDDIWFIKSMRRMFTTLKPEKSAGRSLQRLKSIINTSLHSDAGHAKVNTSATGYQSFQTRNDGTQSKTKGMSLLPLPSEGVDTTSGDLGFSFNMSIQRIVEVVGMNSESSIKGMKIDKSIKKMKSDLISRAMKVSNQCKRLSPFGVTSSDMSRIMTNKNSSLAYCFIPKCGCTFWKRVIRFLNKDFKDKHVHSPFQIRRIETHSWVYTNPNTFIPFNVFSNISHIYKRFMFVREPYSRLWSAYIDKFYLPDFWYDFHKKINDNRSLVSARPCVNDVTFEEFVSLSLVTHEPHWDPMTNVCDPCRFKPSFIGRLESFGSDSKFILETANLSWILDGYDHDSHVQEEIVTLINYNFELFAIKPYIIKCISKSGMFGRLWKSFQINGYLPVSAVMPDLDNLATIEQFKRIVLEEFRKRPNTPEIWRKQRKEFMIDAYKTIPTSRMKDLRMKYARDFLLFNYDPKPVEFFSYRH